MIIYGFVLISILISLPLGGAIGNSISIFPTRTRVNDPELLIGPD
jgi:hypothetical protein